MADSEYIRFGKVCFCGKPARTTINAKLCEDHRKTPKGPFTCRQCNRVYTSNRARIGEGEKFCSRECAFLARAKAKADRAAAIQKRSWKCVDCGITLNKYAKRCASCSSVYDRKRLQLFYRTYQKPHKCPYCSIEWSAIVRVGRRKHCFDTKCEMAHIAKQNAERGSGRHEARAKKYGSERRYFNVLWVFNRDKWKCQLCGVSTPKSLKGSYASKAPELDHIVPLSKGGAHTKENTQCACRQCNSAKGAKPLGQTLLFG